MSAGAMVSVTIDVTQGNIDAGCKVRGTGISDGGNCPVLRAVRRALPGLERPWVTRDSICQVAVETTGLFTDELTVIAALPGEACDFIALFDNDRPVAPFSFTVTVPQPVTIAPIGAS